MNLAFHAFDYLAFCLLFALIQAQMSSHEAYEIFVGLLMNGAEMRYHLHISSAHKESPWFRTTHLGKNFNLPIYFAVLLSKWQVSGRIMIHGHSLVTISWASLVFPVLSDDIPEKFDLPM